MKFLVDADVLSEPTKPAPTQRIVDWLIQHDQDLAVSPIIFGELEYGMLLLTAGRRRTRLLDWYSGGVNHLNVVDFDSTTASVWAKLLADLKRKGRAMPIKDSLIAASALQHGLTIVTRKVVDYRYFGARITDPFSAA